MRPILGTVRAGRPPSTRARRPILAGGQTYNATDLPTVCWCERKVMWVPRRMVQAGRTRSCGTRLCEAMDR